MFDVEEEIVLKVFDESPRFRRDYIEKKCLKSSEMFKIICNHYQLNLIKEVYLMHVNIESFNSQKRAKLKEQEIVLIKKLKVFERLEYHMNEVVNEVSEIDIFFTQYFKDDYHEVVDHDVSYQIIFNFVEIYFKEYEKRKRSQSKK